jgi:hypothetical protein
MKRRNNSCSSNERHKTLYDYSIRARHVAKSGRRRAKLFYFHDWAEMKWKNGPKESESLENITQCTKVFCGPSISVVKLGPAQIETRKKRVKGSEMHPAFER